MVSPPQSPFRCRRRRVAPVIRQTRIATTTAAAVFVFVAVLLGGGVVVAGFTTGITSTTKTMMIPPSATAPGGCCFARTSSTTTTTRGNVFVGRNRHAAPSSPTTTWTRTTAPASSSFSSTQLFATGSGGGGADLFGATTDSSSALTAFLLQTLIANGVPALFTVLVIAFAAKVLFGGNRSDKRRQYQQEEFDNLQNPAAALYRDLYGDQDQYEYRRQSVSGGGGGGGMFKKLFGGGGGGRDQDDSELPRNVGVPRDEYFRLKHYNRKLDSYRYSLEKATASKAKAAATYRQLSFERALNKALSHAVSSNDGSASFALTASQWQELQDLEREALKKAVVLQERLLKAQQQLAQLVVDRQLESELGFEQVYQLTDPPPDDADYGDGSDDKDKTDKKKPEHKKKKIMSTGSSTSKSALASKISLIRGELEKLELEFVADVLDAVGPKFAVALRTALLGDVATRGIGSLLANAAEERPLTALLSSASSGANATTSTMTNGYSKPVLYVTRFPGDPSASQVATLREEVTAIVRQARSGIDEALVILQTGGGTVTGYGLAAAQLIRLKEEGGLKLTIAVEQVAASGGYMMCCVADKIVASPFAVLGSIGVISDIPNVYERLKTEGIEFQTVTAGKYKRTLTPTKKVTREDYEKTKQDIEEVFNLFRDFVAKNRPQLDIEKVATGETWFGQDALDRNLCDEIMPVDSVLTDYVDRGYDVFEVEYAPPLKLPFGGLLSPAGSSVEAGGSQFLNDDGSGAGLLGRFVRWLVRVAASEIRDEIGQIAREAAAASGDFGSTGSVSDSNVRPLEERYMAQNDDANLKRTEA